MVWRYKSILNQHRYTLWILNLTFIFHLGTGRVPDQQVNLDMKHGVEAKNYEEVCLHWFLVLNSFQKFGISFKNTFILCSPRLYWSDKKNTVKQMNIVKYYYHLKQLFFLNIICDAQLIFQHHYSSLQWHMIFRNHPNTLIYCSRNMYCFQCWKQLCCLMFFCRTHDTFFSGFSGYLNKKKLIGDISLL